jgi:DNA-binding PadR family transcriptional regulator
MTNIFDSIGSSLRNLDSSRQVEVGRNFIVNVSEAIAQAAAEAAKEIRTPSEAAKPELSLADHILHVLADGDRSSASLKKALTERSGGVIPNQAELTAALEQLISGGLVVKTTASGKTSFSITDLGRAALITAMASENKAMGSKKQDCNCLTGNNVVDVVKQSQRLSSAVLDGAVNGTPGQRVQISKELEAARLRVLSILAGNKLD